MQQSRYTDIQLLQQQLMLKKLQELQRQQQLPQLCDIRQENNGNHHFSVAKKAVGDLSQVPLMNGTPIHDTSQLFTSWDQRSASAIVHGWQNRVGSSVEQGQTLHETSFLTQRLGASGGSPVAISRSSDNHGSHLRGISPETANLFARSGDLQPSTLTNQFLEDQPSISSEQVCMSGGGYMDEEGCLVQNMFVKQSCNSGPLQGNLQPINVLQTSTPLQGYSWKQDQTCWSGNLQQEPTQVGCSQELDPLEKKILFNSDDNIWDASGRKSGGFGSLFEAGESLPSLQSGSWSALMQSAVAETSSGDTGLTEEWSGLTVQNAENSISNQPSVVDSGNQPSRWVDANSQSSFSISSKPIHAFTSLNSGFPVLQHSPMQEKQYQKSVTLFGQWLDHNSQQLPKLNASSIQYYEHPQVEINHPSSISPHFNLRPSNAKEQGEKYEATCKVESGNNAVWHRDNANALQGWRMNEGSRQLCSATPNLLLRQEDPKNMYLSNSHNFEVVYPVANQQVTNYGLPNFSSQIDIPILEKENDCADRNSGQVRSTDSLLIANEAVNETYPVSNVRDKFTGHDQQYTEQLKFFNNASNIINISNESASYDGGNLTKSYQISSAEDHKSKISAPPDGPMGSDKINVTTLRSVGERDWAQATNHLIEKVDNELDGWKTKFRSKRRIILATQLMQQLLRAPPAWTLSLNAALTYDCLTFIAAKTAVGDASALTDCPNSIKISEKVEVYLKNGDVLPTKLVEDITSKMRTLEDNIVRLEKTSSLVSDVRLELQELERYRVINRFAAFHVRPQQTSSGGTPLKPNPQRHVVGNLMAEMPPELQCLPL